MKKILKWEAILQTFLDAVTHYSKGVWALLVKTHWYYNCSLLDLLLR